MRYSVPFKPRFTSLKPSLDILRPDEIERIERDYAVGIPARVIVDIFRPRGVRPSEATFRKYVQAGLLPRSRRVGRKGKHRGSQGVYPVDAVRRINAIKMMMAAGLTIDDIKSSFLVMKGHLDQAERELINVIDGLEGQLGQRSFIDSDKRDLERQMRLLKVRAHELIRDISRIGSRATVIHSPSVLP